MAPDALTPTSPASTTSSHSPETQAIRDILAQHARLPVDARGLDAESDLYGAGLTSLATVGVMLALENHFDIEFPETLLKRGTFRSIASIAEAVASLAS